ncbi:MAG: sigma 54-interacting transcriptional regulator [Verrucomicrobia bacterium]|jgi:Nif-specific regulatory protein|nr:sigma 54-interacting transcriptional regulator [Verrucomicrobiota bacterium]MBT7065560.1 sigma 54-interacting transcriptional regulator [Verrucomicrobiota bacterium]MBT7701092.1 sigma 54-interacting transcriptional regulator [Verrucomicrobiota bacterium]
MTEEQAAQNRAKQELSVLYRISQHMAQQHDVSSLLNDVLDILALEIGIQRAAFALRRPDSDVFVVEAARGMSAEEQRRGQYGVGEGITGRVAQSGEPALVPDISQDPNFLNRTRSRQGDKTAFLCIPVVHQRIVIGTMSIDRPSAPLEVLQHDLHFLKLVGDILAEGVSRIREDIEERDGLIAENRHLRQQLGDRYHPSNMVGNCSSMRQVYDQIAQVADSTATVLVRGSSGTGKELVARAIHYSSSRRNNAFIGINCAALPENLIESELFGHEKGSFTGAAQQRKGRFELANGGTLFLDEIGDIAPSVQVRLLRALQERTIERVGGNVTIPINVRIVTATSRDLEKEIGEGNFREDLYYRLNVFPIHIPALRDRRSDIMLLADSFIHKYNEAYGKQIRRTSTAAINMMMAYHWPGNVRELENCIERAVLTSQDEVIHAYSLPPSLQTADQTNTALIPREGVSLKEMLDSYEREVIIDTLKKHRGNAAAAARDLQTTPRIMNYAVKRLDITPGKYRG